MKINLSPSSVEDYRTFLRVKQLPVWRVVGRGVEFPDEYASLVLSGATPSPSGAAYTPSPFLWDYQRGITATAVRKQKFAAFLDCGLGKTLILLDFARHALERLPPDRCVLIVSPLMVVRQTMLEAERFYRGSLPIQQLRARDLGEWLESGTSRLGITNYEALTDRVRRGRLGALILDESSMLKSHYGKWGRRCIDLGRGLDWKLCLTGTPAPNDRIEYANHAVFLDQFPTVNAFLARYFVNRGQTDNRWELKPHALRPFYRSLSHWCVFMTNPATYGWRDVCADIPPINVHIHDVPLTDEQKRLAHGCGFDLFGTPGGITKRAVLSQIAKGHYRGQDVPTNKPDYIRDLVASWPDESTIVWCHYNREQDTMERTFPYAASVRGETPEDKREELILDFKEGARRALVSKAKVLGFGLNLQIATRQVFSGLQDSYESYYQAVKRSNRYGSTRPLNVHIPVTAIEYPMVETVLVKAKRVQSDTEEQEQMFKESMVRGEGIGDA